MITDERLEGLYVNPEPYPQKGTVGSTVMTRFERVNGDCSVTTIILTSLETVHAVDRMRAILRKSDDMAARCGLESREVVATRDSIASCVSRLIEIGLPESVALHARDALAATVENLDQRRRCGEWEPR